MKQRYAITYILILLWMIAGCTPTIIPPTPSGEGLALDRVVVVGSCLAAGMSNSEVRQAPGLPPVEVPFGGFYKSGQTYSFANIVSSSLERAGAPPLRQPTIGEEGSGHLKIATVVAPKCEEGLLDAVLEWQDSQANWQSQGPGDEFDNLAIPHIMLRDVFKGSTNYNNPYATWLIGRQNDTLCYSDFVSQKNASLNLIALGMEDVLYYAYNGGGEGNPYPMTEVDLFETNYRRLLQVLLQNSQSQAVILNIPDVTKMPFFTKMTHQYTDPTTCEKSTMYVEDNNGQAIPVGEQDLVLLSARHAIETGRGTEANPLPEKLVLDQSEITEIRARITAYNNALDAMAKGYNGQGTRVVVVDIYQLFERVSQGTYDAGIPVSATYFNGGFYSLDGMMPTPRGQAMIANKVLETLQEKFPKLSLPTVSISSYPDIRVP
ncbi:MAG: hypothetical protein AB8F95_14530 [Bacteroidia bacterium]